MERLPTTNPHGVMTAEEIKEAQDLLAVIGSGKRDGYIYMATTDGKIVRDGVREAEGNLFVHNADSATIIGNLIEGLGLDPKRVAEAIMWQATKK